MSSREAMQALVAAVQAWAERTDTPVMLVIGAEPPTVLACGTAADRARLMACVMATTKEDDHGDPC